MLPSRGKRRRENPVFRAGRADAVRGIACRAFCKPGRAKCNRRPSKPAASSRRKPIRRKHYSPTRGVRHATCFPPFPDASGRNGTRPLRPRRPSQAADSRPSMYPKNGGAHPSWSALWRAPVRSLFLGVSGAVGAGLFAAVGGAILCLADGLPWAVAGAWGLRGAFGGLVAGVLIGALTRPLPRRGTPARTETGTRRAGQAAACGGLRRRPPGRSPRWTAMASIKMGLGTGAEGRRERPFSSDPYPVP